MSTIVSQQPQPRVVVIGGGATGTGIVRELAENGYRATLIERGSLGSGTSGHFHGMLHSGARYVVNDPAVAADCYRENQILRRIAPSAIIDTGGMFVALTEPEAAHADTIIQACQKAGIPVEEISREQALEMEPHLTHRIRRAFLVPDGYIRGEEIIRLNRVAAESSSATILEHHEVTKLHRKGERITEVVIKNTQTNESQSVECDFIINAAGVWAPAIAKLAGASIDMVYDKGTMIAFTRRFSNRVLNRCRPEADGDLLVTNNSRSVMGTTARVVASPDDTTVTQEEVDLLMAEGAALIPQLQHAEVKNVYAGVRPLSSAPNESAKSSSRGISRSFEVIDHADVGIENYISVVGGKVTLYRLMAERAVEKLRSKMR